jgi:hypothetical protein
MVTQPMTMKTPESRNARFIPKSSSNCFGSPAIREVNVPWELLSSSKNPSF